MRQITGWIQIKVLITQQFFFLSFLGARVNFQNLDLRSSISGELIFLLKSIFKCFMCTTRNLKFENFTKRSFS